MGYFSPRYHFKAQAKSKSRSKKHFDWWAAGLLFVGALTFFTVLFPDASGLWGQNASKFLGWLAGAGRYGIPIFIGWIGWNALFRKEKRFEVLRTLLIAGLFFSFLVFLSLVGQAIWNENLGGIFGFAGEKLFHQMFGVAGSWIVTVGLTAAFGILLTGKSPGEVLHHLVDAISSDWAEWRKGRLSAAPKAKAEKPPVVAPNPALAKQQKPPKPLKISGQENEAALPLSKIPSEPVIKSKPIEKPKKPEPISVGEKAPGDKPASNLKYSSPSLEIFDTVGGGNPVPKEELTSRAKLLEQTLANFNIAAAVVEIHPGPVITRYDLEPAPGVKVASISSRAADLALAMRSIGIRVLAPIPGKGAVGVEIPNSNPEAVGLQELLAKPEFVNHKSPIAFVLGKTVSGEPYIVDLAAMPHMLIAGATGAGKSVCVHALISSILYRATPNQVKFCLIDPKRLELPGYSQIPHLYDPCHQPIQAEVITNSKQAAKALSRLVKIMEYRYDQFAKANVRNIDSYNQKRKQQGLPPEYYLVVIIDELADLMLTSPKEVEDSIQRLAQMARAVGIHLVLATQRPSVDVITGVIKANLPARIALRVASAIDSRVIVDTGGAELLLGKGDMLFLPPASPEPIRVQGAYVSEKEVQSLVDHVKQFGLPEYEDLFSSGSALEFAVEDKKEMKDLIEALKLVLERHRVSQDLLKAHFGSSARATNILSLLEVKEFIHKPEGTNRWEINFDMIEEFLAKVNMVSAEEQLS